MSDADRARWNERYRAGSHAERGHPCPLLTIWRDALAAEHPGGRALDVACGRGRNALFLAEAGFTVDALDVSDVAIGDARRRGAQLGLTVDWQVADLDHAALEAQAYDVVVVARYLNRARIPDLIDALRPGGTVVYEQHVELDPVVDPGTPVGGPRTRGFRLRANELLRLFLGLCVRHYEEGVFRDPDGTRMALARLVATRWHP